MSASASASASVSMSASECQNQYPQNQYPQNQYPQNQNQIVVLTQDQIVEIATKMSKTPNTDQKANMLKAIGAYNTTYDPHKPMQFTFLNQVEAVYTVAGCLRYYGNGKLEQVDSYYQVSTEGRKTVKCK